MTGGAANENEILLGERGWRDTRLVPVAGVNASWLVSEAGDFSAFVRADDLRKAGVADLDALAGRWVRWEHPEAGAWGGVVAAVRVDGAEVEIAAKSFHVLLRKRLTPRRRWPTTASAGVVARALLRHASRAEATHVVVGAIDEGLPEVRFTWDRQDVYEDALPSLAGAAGAEWAVDADRRFSFVRRLGEDKSASVKLVDSLHLANPVYAVDFWPVENVLTGYGADPERGPGKNIHRRKRRQPYPEAVIQDAESVARHGPLEGVRDYADTRERDGVAARLRRDLPAVAEPVRTLSAAVPRSSGLWPALREGDTVRVELAEAGVSLDLRIAARAVDLVRDAVEISGAAVRARPPAVVAVVVVVPDYVTTTGFDNVVTIAGDLIKRA